MITWSQFSKLYNETAMPSAAKQKIRREALARYMDRMQAGRADNALDFSDLANQLL